MVEDATDIILNLKQIPFKMHSEQGRTLYAAGGKAGRGARQGHRGRIRTSKSSSPSLHIATVSEGGKLHMELRLKRGRGYVSADKNFDEDLGIG